MLKKIKNEIFKRKKSELNVTPGENVRDIIISVGMKAIEESAYTTVNNTDKLIKFSENFGSVVDRGTELVAGTESASALGKIAFKTTKDIARGDSICKGFCIISGTCETIALCCSTVTVIPFRGKIYVCAKIVSRGCMSFRNACAGEGC